MNCCSHQLSRMREHTQEQFLIAGHDCPLLVFLLLEAVVSQGSLDGVLSQHLVGGKNNLKSVWGSVHIIGAYKTTGNLLEQCSLTGGRHSSLAMSVFFIIKASSTY